MLCCHKTGIQITRCKEVITTNLTSPSSLGKSEHEIIYTGLVALVYLNNSIDDNFDETGQQLYRSFVMLIDETIYQNNSLKNMDTVAFNDGQFMTGKPFDISKLKKDGKIYSVRELAPFRGGKKFREVKIRFDMV